MVRPARKRAACIAARSVPLLGSCGGQKCDGFVHAVCRNLLLFRHGSRPGGNFMSLFLNAAESDTAPPGWMRTATFKLWVINQQDAARSIPKGAAQALEGLRRAIGVVATLESATLLVLGRSSNPVRVALLWEGSPPHAACTAMHGLSDLYGVYC